MVVDIKEMFFPRLKRRDKYKTTRKGTYYADYSQYRHQIREDCLGRCVYCDVHENENGGEENMQLDHFRPKEKFNDLKNNPNNLTWSCAKCNRLKTDDWFAKDKHSTSDGAKGFIDPFLEDRRYYFEVLPDGKLKPLKEPAKYKIQKLELNRPTRKIVRKKRLSCFEVLVEINNHINEIDSVLKSTANVPSDIISVLTNNKKTLKDKVTSLLQSELNFELL